VVQAGVARKPSTDGEASPLEWQATPAHVPLAASKAAPGRFRARSEPCGDPSGESSTCTAPSMWRAGSTGWQWPQPKA